MDAVDHSCSHRDSSSSSSNSSSSSSSSSSDDSDSDLDSDDGSDADSESDYSPVQALLGKAEEAAVQERIASLQIPPEQQLILQDLVADTLTLAQQRLHDQQQSDSDNEEEDDDYFSVSGYDDLEENAEDDEVSHCCLLVRKDNCETVPAAATFHCTGIALFAKPQLCCCIIDMYTHALPRRSCCQTHIPTSTMLACSRARPRY